MTAAPLHPDFALPARSVRAVAHALMLDLLEIDREQTAARQRLAQAATAGAPDHELQAIIQTIKQSAKETGAIRSFLKRIDPNFATDFPREPQNIPPLTPEERAQIMALCKPAMEARP